MVEMVLNMTNAARAGIRFQGNQFSVPHGEIVAENMPKGIRLQSDIKPEDDIPAPLPMRRFYKVEGRLVDGSDRSHGYNPVTGEYLLGHLCYREHEDRQRAFEVAPPPQEPHRQKRLYSDRRLSTIQLL